MTICRSLLLAGLLVTISAVPARADVQLSMRDGLVTLNATGATVREILAAWAKVGQTRIVNGERVPGGPITLQLKDVPEEDALEIILRTVSGYLAAPRAMKVANLSRFDRIFVMPTSTPPRTTSAPVPQAPPAFSPPPFNPPLQPPPPIGEDTSVEPPSMVVPPMRGPIFTPQPGFPTPQPGMPQPVGGAPQPNVPGNTPATGQVPPGRAPIGVAVPGMIVESPQPPPAQREP